jgi:lipoate---protein ligase
VTWQLERHRGSARDLHAMPLPDPPVASVWVCEPTAAALILGSTQAALLPALSGAGALEGIEVVVRRSGGAAVLLVPGACTWIDVVVPAGHHLWASDVGRATHWLGDLWVDALARLGIEGHTHRGRMVRTPWSPIACFAGIGPGEVVDPRGAKLVGISQRRTRSAARFQTLVHHDDPAAISELLGLDPEAAAELRAHLGRSAAVVPCRSDALVDAVVTALPR